MWRQRGVPRQLLWLQKNPRDDGRAGRPADRNGPPVSGCALCRHVAQSAPLRGYQGTGGRFLCRCRGGSYLAGLPDLCGGVVLTEKICAGWLILGKKENLINNNFRLRMAQMQNLLSLDQFKNEDQIFDSAEEAIRSHGK